MAANIESVKHADWPALNSFQILQIFLRSECLSLCYHIKINYKTIPYVLVTVSPCVLVTISYYTLLMTSLLNVHPGAYSTSSLALTI